MPPSTVHRGACAARCAAALLLIVVACTGRGAAAPAGGVPGFSHIFTILLENQEYDAVTAAPPPYLRSLLASYGSATRYYAATHPSLPNYLALTGGSTFGLDGSDCSPGPDCRVRGVRTNLADQLEAAHRTWAAYMEGMPAPCTLQNAGRYAVRHDPFVYYDSIRLDSRRCAAHVLPYDPIRFGRMLGSTAVPSYVWISPDICDDGHDACASDRLAQADAWLRANVPPILRSPAWRAGGVLFILWDEGTTGAGWGAFAAGGHTVALVIAPPGTGRRAFRSSVPYSSYSYLRTVEDAWGLPHLGHAGCACTPSMRDFFAR